MSRSTGDAMLDEMLGGGVPEGRTLLFRGPSGVGKSRLAMQFLDAGAHEGEDCLYVTTDEPLGVVRSSLDPAESVSLAAVHRDTSGGGVRFVTADGADTIPFGSLIERLSGDEWDRLVVDGAGGLVELAPDRERGRHGRFHLLERLDDHATTAVLTATDDEPGSVARLAHGVVDCWREEIEGDARPFCRVEKLRSRDHDTRRHALAHDDDGVTVTAREWATHEDPFRTGIPTLDDLTGGFVRNGTTLFEHDGTADHWPFTAALVARAVEQDAPVVLVTAPGTLVNRVDGLLSDAVAPVTELMDRNLLYLIDPISRSPNEPAVAGLDTDNVVLQEEEGSIQEAFRTLVAALGGRVEEAVAIIEHSAMAHLVTENESRQLYYWADGNLMNGEYDLTLVLTGDRAVAGDRLTAFFSGVADQVIRTWRGNDELQYLSVPKSPAGTPGHTRVVEPLEVPPYVRLR
jgi:circadian clock protein KaiC